MYVLQVWYVSCWTVLVSFYVKDKKGSLHWQIYAFLLNKRKTISQRREAETVESKPTMPYSSSHQKNNQTAQLQSRAAVYYSPLYKKRRNLSGERRIIGTRELTRVHEYVGRTPYCLKYIRRENLESCAKKSYSHFLYLSCTISQVSLIYFQASLQQRENKKFVLTLLVQFLVLLMTRKFYII